MSETLDAVPRHRLEKGWHTPVETPHLFIDGCVQIWSDSNFAELNRYGVAGYLITTCRPHDGPANALDAFADWWRIAATYPAVRLALTAADITEAKRNNQAAIILGCQGGDFIGQEIWRLQMFQRLGLRVMIPAYNARTPLADGYLEPANAGLSRLGRKWVAECNRVGVLIDCTHVGERSSLEILELTEKPVVFSHSNPRKLVDVSRNITDEQIRRCAATGGVIGQTNWGPLNFRANAQTRPTLSEFLDAIAYVADLVGIDHVSIGTDMSHGTYPDGDRIRGRGTATRYATLVEGSPRSRRRNVEGFDDYGQINQVAEAMQARRFSDVDIAKIFGGNLLRVFAAAW